MAESTNQITYSVSDFIAVLNQTLDYAYPAVVIEGEVASFKVNQGKYVFFDLKDADGSINCFMTVWQLRLPIEDGMKVVVSATPKLTQWGKFSLTIKSIRPSGEGAIKKSYDILKAKLDKEGLFAPERKRLIPEIPTHIGVISSVQAAGYTDFIKILDDRWCGIKIDVANVQVQGASAPDQIIRAINYFNQLEVTPELIVITRGGGSADDLSAFNDEPLVRAIAASRIPTVVGVGHEVDETLADLAADVRASTPSHAAQLISPSRIELVRLNYQKVQSVIPRINYRIEKDLSIVRSIVVDMTDGMSRFIDNQTARLHIVRQTLNQLNPQTILNRGYAIIRGSVELGSLVEIETNKVILEAEVKNVINK